jgi:hypothetical protein
VGSSPTFSTTHATIVYRLGHLVFIQTSGVRFSVVAPNKRVFRNYVKSSAAQSPTERA